MKRILALQNTWDDPLGYLGEILQEHGIAFDMVNLEHEPIPDAHGYDAMIALGGYQHANADELYPYLALETALIRSVVEQDVPYLGICLGAQLLARAFGAPVKRHHMTEIGFFDVQLTPEGQNDPLFKGLLSDQGYQRVIQWHEDTFALPKDAVWLATNENTAHQAFRLGRHAYGIQYHIELTPPMLDTWLQYPDYRKEIVRELGPDGPDMIERDRPTHYPIYRQHARMLFENFLKISGCV